MKRFLKTVLAASMIAFSVGITSSAIYVPPYPEYLNEDSSYPLVYGHMGALVNMWTWVQYILFGRMILVSSLRSVLYIIITIKTP